MNTAPETKPTAAEEQGESALGLIDGIHERAKAVGAIAFLVEFCARATEAKAEELESVDLPSGQVLGRAVWGIDALLEDIERYADQLFEMAKRAPKAEPSK